MLFSLYFLVALGCWEAGWSFGRSLLWPNDVGRLLVRAVAQKEGG